MNQVRRAIERSGGEYRGRYRLRTEHDLALARDVVTVKRQAKRAERERSEALITNMLRARVLARLG